VDESGHSAKEKFQNSKIKKGEDREGLKTEVKICSFLYLERHVHNNICFIQVLFIEKRVFL
jgi:hypothetical protein